MSMLHGIVSAARLARTGSQHGQRSAWPNGTTVSTHDILIEERSLTAHAHTRGTPCVLISHVGESDDRAGRRTVVLATVLERVQGRRLRPDEITVNCDLRTIRTQCLEARLLNSPRALARTPMLIHSCDDQSPPLQVTLPRETSPGDLLALVCRGTIAASQTRPHIRHPESADDEWHGRCMK